MSDAIRHIAVQTPINEAGSLYMWRGNGIVLIGQRDEQRWVLARGWMTGDALEHVRRWSFSAPGPFAGQVRRLVAEATGNHVLARDESARALAWVAANVDPA
jgi:hypothetical protein